MHTRGGTSVLESIESLIAIAPIVVDPEHPKLAGKLHTYSNAQVRNAKLRVHGLEIPSGGTAE